MKPPVDIDLLKKFARNECSPQELAQVREYLLQPEYREALAALLDQQWQDFSPPAPDTATILDWKMEFEQRLAAAPRLPSPKQRPLRWLGYAAACMIPLLFAMLVLRQQKKSRVATTQVVMNEVRNPRGRVTTIVLPDSSVIALGPDSRLQYPRAFSGSTREIILEGEAFFEVTPNPEKPFMVRTGQVLTRVLGTSFKITALPQRPIWVSVATGKVSVSRTTAEKEELLATLLPGKQARYDPVGAALELRDFRPADAIAWKAGMLSFNEIAFAEVIAGLERWYDVRISLALPDLAHKKMKLVVNGKRPVSEALETIRQMTGLHYRINAQEIQIY